MQIFKQHGLKVFENKVLREICVTEGTGKDVLVHNRYMCSCKCVLTQLNT